MGATLEKPRDEPDDDDEYDEYDEDGPCLDELGVKLLLASRRQDLERLQSWMNFASSHLLGTAPPGAERLLDGLDIDVESNRNNMLAEVCNLIRQAALRDATRLGARLPAVPNLVLGEGDPHDAADRH